MANVEMVIIGPAHGTFAAPRSLAVEASTGREAVSLAASETDLDLVRDRPPGFAPGVTLFINEADARFHADPEAALQDGDVLMVLCPATDT